MIPASRPLGAPQVIIRPCSADDAPAMHEAVRESLAELIPWMPWCHPEYSLQEARSWLRVQVQAFNERKWFEFAIVDEDGRYLGQCGLNQFDDLNRRCNLGYWVRTRTAGRGVATRAVCLLREWAFAHTTLVRIEIVVASGNHPSLRVAEKAGAAREGLLRHRLLLHGAPADAVMFSFVRQA
ncbi:MAG: GNAT family N-acetyltransferase [Acidobacteria bacterium]|nr:GNAT family N-acetyltransferase [Acidobacteriota bacterium]